MLTGYEFLEAAYMAKMMSGGKKPVITTLTVTANGTYTAPAGVDGYSPVIVGVPDRYQEGYDKGKTDGEKEGYDNGYADGVNSVVIKPLTVTENKTYNASDYECSGFNPVNGNVPDKYQDGYDDGYDIGFKKGVEYVGGSVGPIITQYLLLVQLRHGTNPWYPLSDLVYAMLYEKVDGGWKKAAGGDNYYVGPQGAATSYEMEIVSVVLLEEEYGHAYLNLKGWNDSHTTMYEASYDIGSKWFSSAHFNSKNCTITDTEPTDIVE